MEQETSVLMNQPNTDSSEAEDEDEEDPEPKLKYMRMKNDLENIFASKNSATCIAVHPKFMFLGTHWGSVHMLDHQGNKVRDDSKHLQAHSVGVNQISIDSNGDYIASCSDDGKVYIHGLYSSDNNQKVDLGQAVKSVAIDPNYSKPGSGRRFITGTEQLVLHEKTFLARLKPTPLASAEGNVHNIKWNGQFVAWADNIGVRVFDINARCSLGLIKWNRHANALPENYRCNLCWKDSATLLIGWVDSVRICNIRRRTTQELAAGRDLPEFIVEKVSEFETDFYISGMGPLDKQLVILGYPKELDIDGNCQRPAVYVLEPHAKSYIELCSDFLSLRGYRLFKCVDYHLECLTEENNFFIMSPKDVVVATPYDADDRIQWLMEHSKYETAMEAVKVNGHHLRRHSLLQVGRAYLDHLLEKEEYEKAGRLCQDILGKDKRLWEEEVFKFARIHQLRAVSPFLPLGDHRLDPTIYEMVLYEFLKMDAEGFLKLVKEWSPDLYNVTAVVNALLAQFLVNEANTALRFEALAILYSHDRKYDKALAMYLKLRHKDVFKLIHKHDLYGVIHDMIEGLVELDAEQAIAMFLEKDHVPADVVVAKLSAKPYYQYMYLDALDRKDGKSTSRKYHGLLVKLYADYARDKLLPLLRRSDHYPIQEALNICKDRCFYSEMVYLLGRIGNTKEALNLITQKLGDIEQAVNFCKEQGDDDLWQDLISYSLNKPDFITFLLQRIGTYTDPLILVERLENGTEIPGLKNSLVKMMRDYSLQVSVQEGCKKILASDYFNLHDRLVNMQQRGILVDDDHVCASCGKKVIVKDKNRASNIVMFFCKHSFHQECLPRPDALENCSICNSQKLLVY